MPLGAGLRCSRLRAFQRLPRVTKAGRAARAVESTHLAGLQDQPFQDSRSVGSGSSGEVSIAVQAESLRTVEPTYGLSER